MSDGGVDHVPVRMLNEHVYCPRLAYLEWVQAEWADNVYTEHGRAVHRRVDRATQGPPGPEDDVPFSARAVSLSSDRLGLSTRLDLIEGENGSAVPVEYKRGKPARNAHRVYDPERVQVCAQALILRDHGYTVPHAEVYFAGTRERVRVDLNDDLIDLTMRALEDLRDLSARGGPIPPPLVDSPKCDGCSLVTICLPDEVEHLTRARPRTQPLRRLHPARDDARPLYVQQGGTKVGVSGDVLVVREKGKKIAEARLEHTSHVSIFGGAQVSTQALRRLLQRDIPLAVFSAGGWFYGWARGLGSRNIELRRAQFRAADDPVVSLTLARSFVTGKIANQRTLLRRNHPDPGPTLKRLSQLKKRAASAESAATLLGLEGTAARLYFGAFPGLLKVDAATGGTALMSGRTRRPPRDPVNAVLSFLYALLAKEWTVTCALVGLDPYLGFYHTAHHGRPSLALDLMEEFRPLVADSVGLSVFNKRELTEHDFIRRGTECALNAKGRKSLIAAYERRLGEPITHPVFGYKISYRRIIEVQARLLGRFLLGEVEAYPSFQTR